MATAIRLENVTQRFGGVVALNQVSFDVEEREITGLIGPNGSGKTTAFNIMSGFIKPTEGRVFLGDRDVTLLPPHKLAHAGLARTFQTPKLFGTLTVRETIELAAASAGNDTNVDEALAIADQIGLRGKSDHFPDELTTADMHAVEITKALATGAELILLDEVFAGLNASEIDRMVQVIRDLSRTKTFVIIEHRMRAVMALCEKIHVLLYGRLAVSGSAAEVTSNSEVIKAYLGEEAQRA